MPRRHLQTGLPLALLATLACGDPALGPLAQRVAGCGPGTPGGEPLAGAYDYAACDDAGRLVLLGRLTIAIDPAGAVSGTWEIDWAPGADCSTDVGPQTGTGELVGSLEGGVLFVDLNPGWADANVLLSGTWRGGGASGSWTFVGFTGPRTSGTFIAARR
jgi:hypothetical protein